MTLTLTREFLIRLAPIWLKCRWRVIHGSPSMEYDLLGMNDYAAEMKLMCEDVLNR